MSKKTNNLKLLIILAVLAGIYFMVDYTGGKKKSKSLRTELVSIDTAKASKLSIESKGQTVDLYKEGEAWKLKLPTGKIVTADNRSIGSTVGALLTIKPSRMVSRKKSKWSEYQVDSTGVRVKVYEGSENTLDIMLGKFGMKDRNAYHTFVRLFEDNEVYAADDFMSFSIPSEPSAFRDQDLAVIQSDSLTAIIFTYPADSSIQLSNNEGNWSVNGQLTDSTKVATYLSDVSYVSSKAYYDEETTFSNPIMTVRYSFSNQEDIFIEAYQKNGIWIFHSLENDANYFNDVTLLDKVFKGKYAFMK